jgi:hypothetical protein
MFNIGDLVRFKNKGVVKRNREHRNKTIALVIEIERNVFYTYQGDYDDKIRVKWMPLGEEEAIPEFLLEKVTEYT